jgi:hypothetical protein
VIRGRACGKHNQDSFSAQIAAELRTRWNEDRNTYRVREPGSRKGVCRYSPRRNPGTPETSLQTIPQHLREQKILLKPFSSGDGACDASSNVIYGAVVISHPR